MRPLKLFYCYAHEDKPFREELDVHLAGLKRQQLLTTWYDGEIKAGAEWEQEINHYLSTADLIVLFVSPHFLHSDYCYNVEMQRALKRHEAKTAHVIPIVVRPVYWQDAPFSKLQLLPAEAKPISRWPDRDEIWLEIVREIYTIILDLQTAFKTKLKQLVAEGDMFLGHLQYEEALTTYEQAIQLDEAYADAYVGKGYTLYSLMRYEEALSAYEQAIQLDPKHGDAHLNKGRILYKLKRCEEALAAYEQAIELDATYADAYRDKGNALYDLERYEEALVAYEQAIQLAPTYAGLYGSKHAIFSKLD